MKMKTFASKTLASIAILALFMLMIFSTSCENQAKGFVLPEGDVESGQQAFVNLNCDNCHSIADLPWTGNAANEDPNIPLGGNVTTIKSYGELVTSVINPSHKISQTYQDEKALTNADGSSKMERYSYNYVMTVQELVDIVTFLQAEYKLVMPDKTYPY